MDLKSSFYSTETLKLTATSVSPPASKIPEFGFLGSCLNVSPNVAFPELPVFKVKTSPNGFPLESVSKVAAELIGEVN